MSRSTMAPKHGESLLKEETLSLTPDINKVFIEALSRIIKEFMKVAKVND